MPLNLKSRLDRYFPQVHYRTAKCSGLIFKDLIESLLPKNIHPGTVQHPVWKRLFNHSGCVLLEIMQDSMERGARVRYSNLFTACWNRFMRLCNNSVSSFMFLECLCRRKVDRYQNFVLQRSNIYMIHDYLCYLWLSMNLKRSILTTTSKQFNLWIEYAFNAKNSYTGLNMIIRDGVSVLKVSVFV